MGDAHDSSIDDHLAKIDSFADLEENWDRQGGGPIAATVVQYAKNSLRKLHERTQLDFGSLHIVALTDGSVEFEYDREDVTVTCHSHLHMSLLLPDDSEHEDLLAHQACVMINDYLAKQPVP